jgi:hypothetical protein
MMQKGTMYSRAGGIVLIIVILVAVGAVKANYPVNGPRITGADLIFIDSMKTLGPLERAPVPFFHSLHTAALASTDRGCKTCHLTDAKGHLSTKFKRLTDANRQKVTDIYHINCIGCHHKLADQGQKSGPQICGGCHQDNPSVASTWRKITFDKSLHYRHIKALGENCERCHHEYDKQAHKLVHIKGQEGACIYCHKDKPVGNTLALEQASHLQCIGCHRDRRAAHQKAGPVECVGCHDADYQKDIAVVKSVPRIQRDQPDVVLIRSDEATPPNGTDPAAMFPVPFDHKAHETYNSSCKVCHHASLQSCGSCHTNAGTKQGGQVKLVDAMHKVTSPSSCVGCHRLKQRAPACRGCHGFIATTDKPAQQSCKVCHFAPLPSDIAATDTHQLAQAARDLLQRRDSELSTHVAYQMPDKVTIGKLSNNFEPVVFPHGKMVNALIARTRGSKLADYFHSQPGTLCQGCHHNSPPEEKPPLCSNCHGETIAAGDAFRTGLEGAFHQQCLGCHKAMGVKYPGIRDCKACHARRKTDTARSSRPSNARRG